MANKRLVAGLFLVAAVVASGWLLKFQRTTLPIAPASSQSASSQPPTQAPSQSAPSATQTPSAGTTASPQNDPQLNSESAAADQGLNQLDQNINDANQPSNGDDGGN